MMKSSSLTSVTAVVKSVLSDSFTVNAAALDTGEPFSVTSRRVHFTGYTSVRALCWLCRRISVSKRRLVEVMSCAIKVSCDTSATPMPSRAFTRVDVV